MPWRDPSELQQHVHDCSILFANLLKVTAGWTDIQTLRNGLKYSSVNEDDWSCMLCSDILEIVGKTD